MRKVFLENLPRWGKGGKAKEGSINWSASIGYKVRGIYEDINFEVEIVNYESKGQLLYVKYLDNEPLKIYSNNFQKCSLGKLLGKITDEFKVEIGATFKDEKRDIIIIDRKYIFQKRNNQNCKYYKYKCNKCGYDEGLILEGSLLGQETGCACCSNQIAVEGINSIADTDAWMVKFFSNPEDAKMYTRSSGKHVKVVCPDCGKNKDKVRIADIYRNKSIGCSCGDGKSYPNKFMFNVLEQLNIEFTNEYSPKWIGRKLYDFHIPSENIIIEMDGRLGHGKVIHSKSNKTKEETKLDDEYKDLMADKHGIKVIRINCDESDMSYIKQNILGSKLINYFDFSKIDWLRCEEFALSNRVKEACELWITNINITTTEVGKLMNLNRNTITKYLKQGTKLGWCDYDPKEESKKRDIKFAKETIKRNSKPIEMFRDGECPWVNL